MWRGAGANCGRWSLEQIAVWEDRDSAISALDRDGLKLRCGRRSFAYMLEDPQTQRRPLENFTAVAALTCSLQFAELLGRPLLALIALYRLPARLPVAPKEGGA